MKLYHKCTKIQPEFSCRIYSQITGKHTFSYGFNSEEYREGTKKLVNFYKKSGFKTVKNNVMVYIE